MVIFSVWNNFKYIGYVDTFNLVDGRGLTSLFQFDGRGFYHISILGEGAEPISVWRRGGKKKLQPEGPTHVFLEQSLLPKNINPEVQTQTINHILTCSLKYRDIQWELACCNLKLNKQHIKPN